jgi:predicted nicotinamide N-methyase
VSPSAELIEEVVPVAGREILLRRPSDYDSMLTEEAFEREWLLPYWAHPWPSGIALAETLATRPWRGQRLLELGCGLGLASIAAARAGARVMATDWSQRAVAVTLANAARNEVELEAAVVDWERPDWLLERGPWDLVVAADVLYERRKSDTLLSLLPRLTDEVILADSHRATAEPFFDGLGADWEREVLRRSRQPLVSVHRLRRVGR